MIKVNRAVELRLYPTKEQQEYFAQVFGCTRKVWNLALAECIDNYKTTGKFQHRSYKEYQNEYPYLKDVEAQALCQSLNDLHTAFKNRFNKTSKRQTGFPKFKSKRSRQSYRTCMPRSNALSNKTVKIPKVGEVHFHAKPRVGDNWKLKSITISKSQTNKYHASLLYEFFVEEPQVKLDINNSVCLDYQSNGLFIDNQGKQPYYPRYYRLTESKLAKAQRKLSHMKYGSNNYYKQRLKVAKIHEKIANQRKDFLHKLSYEFANKYDYVFVEDIDLQSIAQFGHLGKSTHDNGFGMFRSLLFYKMADRGKIFHKIDKWFPSSKTCSVCGCYHPELVNSLSVREWTCPDCGIKHNRDINAAINIRNKGMLDITAGTAGLASLCLAH